MIPVKQLRPISKTQTCSLDWQVATGAVRLATGVPLGAPEAWAAVGPGGEATTAAPSGPEMSASETVTMLETEQVFHLPPI